MTQAESSQYTVKDVVPEELLIEWRKLLAGGDSDAALLFYFDNVLPMVVANLEKCPQQIELRKLGCSILVSTMGFSPETTVLAASVLRPERLVIIVSQQSQSALDLAIAHLVKNEILPFSAIRVEDVDPTDTDGIYSAIRRHFVQTAHSGAPIMDVTGGKKVMSATAAIAAWELKIPLCYVEGVYDQALRRPQPGSEKIVLLRNPIQVHASILRKQALECYENGNMEMGVTAFQKSLSAQTSNQHFDQLGLDLCKVQSAMMNLDLAAMNEGIQRLERTIKQSNVQILTEDLPLDEHLRALKEVSRGEPVAMLATFRQLSNRYAAQGRHDFACLLAYRTLEDIVRLALASRSKDAAFDLGAPDITLLTKDPSELERSYTNIWRKLHPGSTITIPQKITFLAGLTLLFLVDDGILVQVNESRGIVKTLRHANGLAAIRNHSVLAHGTRNVNEADVSRLIDFGRELGGAALGEDAIKIESFNQALNPPEIRHLHLR